MIYNIHKNADDKKINLSRDSDLTFIPMSAFINCQPITDELIRLGYGIASNPQMRLDEVKGRRFYITE